MKLTIVGSGTAAPDPERVGAALFLETPDARILVDCGPGALHHLARFGLSWPRLDHLVVSHFHNDHTGDIPALLFALKWGTMEGRTSALHLWGPHGLAQRLRAMAEAFGDHVTDPGFPVAVHELSPGESVELGSALTVACASTPHTDESLAYVFRHHGGASLGYTGDTGESEELARFLAGVDVLVAECSLPDDEAMDTHLTPSRLAAMAVMARPVRLIPTHVYPQLARQDLTALLADAGWDGETVRARDGLEIRIAADPSGHSRAHP
jgi:ribonuclease BN (tRNA processing enzyme)